MRTKAKNIHTLPGRTGFALALLALGIFNACEHASPPPNEPTPVRVAPVGTFEGGGGLKYSANIEAYSQVNLAFKSGGYVDSIIERKGADGRTRVLQIGDRVTQGEVLAHVRESEYRDKVSSAKAQIDQAQANYDKAKLDFERANNLYKSESFTKAQLDAAKAALDAAAASLENAKAGWQQSVTGLSDCRLRSPLSGWVLSRNVEVGTLAGTGTVAFVLADTHLVKAVFGVPDTRVSFAELGSPLTITTTSLPGEFQGRITAVSPSADPKSRVFSVEVTVPNAGEQLKPGMIATIVLETGRREELAVAVPLTAIIRSSQGPDDFAVFVVTASGGKSIVNERPVEIGDTIGNMISVNKGLKPGEAVVITGGTLVKDHDEVRVIQ